MPFQFGMITVSKLDKHNSFIAINANVRKNLRKLYTFNYYHSILQKGMKMLSRIFFVFLTPLFLVISGCANLTSPARDHAFDPTKAYWLDYDASRRGTLVLPESSKVKTCAEPSPDVALTMISKIEAALKPQAGGEVTAKGEFNATVVELAKRTQMVMFLREALFRLCEQSINNNFHNNEAIFVLYKQILEAATDIVKTDQTSAEAKVLDAQNKSIQLQQFQNK